jgi:hypothetical protein
MNGMIFMKAVARPESRFRTVTILRTYANVLGHHFSNVKWTSTPPPPTVFFLTSKIAAPLRFKILTEICLQSYTLNPLAYTAGCETG